MFTRDTLIANGMLMRDRSEEVLESGKPTPVQIGVWKDGVPYVYVYPSSVAMDDLAHIMYACIIGMEPDAISFCADTWASKSKYKSDGTEWQHGEMEMARVLQTPDAALVIDSFTYKMWDRLGSHGEVAWGYTVENGVITWDNPEVSMDGETTCDCGRDHDNEGMTQFIRHAFEQDTMRQTMAKFAELQRKYPEAYAEFAELVTMPPTPIEAMEQTEEDPEMTYALLVAGCIKHVLAPLNCAIAVGSKSRRVHEVLKEQIGQLGHVMEMVDGEWKDPE